MAKKSNEAPPIYAIRKGSSLYGEMEMDRDTICKIPEGVRVRIDIRTGRVPAKLRFYFAFLTDVIEATGCAPNVNIMNSLVKLRTGYTEDAILGGHVIRIPASIALANMDEPTFSTFLESALRFIAEEYGITPEDTERAA